MLLVTLINPIFLNNTNISNRHHTGTNLSKYVWKLKDNQPHSIPYEIEWGILGTDKPFNSVTGVCRLCLLEAYLFIFNEASSNINRDTNLVLDSATESWTGHKSGTSNVYPLSNITKR